MLQSTVGIVRTGPVVVWVNPFATPYDHSHAMIAPGAVDELPLNVQLIVLPLFVSAQVSVRNGPVTPKLAVAPIGGPGGVTESVAEADVPL
jgi:hypothetical protein